MNSQEPMISDRTRIATALTTEQFAAVDYIPASVLVAKRAMDLVVALIGIVLTAPSFS